MFDVVVVAVVVFVIDVAFGIRIKFEDETEVSLLLQAKRLSLTCGERDEVV